MAMKMKRCGQRSSNGRRLRFGLTLCAALVMACAIGTAAPGMAAPGRARPAETTLLTVTNLNPSGSGSLSDAIAIANRDPGVYKIVFASGLSGTIKPQDTLQIHAHVALTIDGGGSIAISGDGARGVVRVRPNATVELENLTIEDGNANDGGVENDGTLTVIDSTFSGNRAYRGGGIKNDNNAKLVVTNSIFSDNRAYRGGGIYNDNNANLAVTNSTFSGNKVGGDFSHGGGIYNTGMVTVTNSTFSGNSADSGGGIFNDGNLTLTNSTFSGNSAGFLGFGNGIFNDGTLTVTNSTFSGTAESDNGEIECGPRAPTTLKGTIVTGGPACGCPDITDGGYNISQDNSCGFSSSNHSHSDYTGTLLSSAGLADNGGPTHTIALDTSGSNAAIDAIPVADCTDSSGKRLTTDQRGYTRPDESESACDIGAYESGATVAGATLAINTVIGSIDLNTPIIFAGAINPVTQNVKLQIGTYSVTIPAGSFVLNSEGDYVLKGTIGDVSTVEMARQSDGSYTLKVQGSGANLTGTTNPVTVTVTLTDASGNVVATSSIAVMATIS